MKYLGRILFWVTWPLIWVYSPMRLRSRMLVVCRGDYLVVKANFGSGCWQLPGGGTRRAESTKHAAGREVFEELGVSLAGHPIKTITSSRVFKETGLPKRYALYMVELTDRPNVKIKKSEISDYAWLEIYKKVDVASHVTYALQHASKPLPATSDRIK